MVSLPIHLSKYQKNISIFAENFKGLWSFFEYKNSKIIEIFIIISVTLMDVLILKHFYYTLYESYYT